MRDITRSRGVLVGATGLVVGGGRSGATHELDTVVERAAELLREAYDCDVVIRFNSDRKSGGAWLKTDPNDRVGVNAEIGVTAGITNVARLRNLFERYPEEGETLEGRLAADGVDPANPPESYVTIHVHAKAVALVDPDMANSGTDEPGWSSLRTRMESVEQAVEFLVDNTRPVAEFMAKPAGPRP